LGLLQSPGKIRNELFDTIKGKASVIRQVLTPIVILGLVLSMSPVQLQGQSADNEVADVVTGLFDAMRTADGAVATALFHPDARLMSASVRNGVPTLSVTPASEFARAVGSPRTEVWDERISGLEIRVDGSLATAWMNYSFYVDDRFSHCGVNAFQLYRGASGWQIIQITDTRRPDQCGTGA